MIEILAACSVTAAASIASVEPTRTYYQTGHEAPFKLTGSGSHELVLLAADNSEVARASVATGDGVVDLAEVFPELWSFDRETHYLQDLLDGDPNGPAIVLQPMREYPRPVLRGTARGPQVERWQEVPDSQLAFTGFRAYVEQYPVLHTTNGDITLVMRPDEAPNTVWNFLELVDGGFYTNIPFHRVIGPARTRTGAGFVIQAGDPTGTGMGGPGYSIDLEPSDLPHDLGVISMAREGNDVNTAGSQFFLCLSREGTSFLDGQYTTFGQTIKGVEVITEIGNVETDQADRPVNMPYVQSAELVDAEPRVPGEKPEWMTPVSSSTGDDEGDGR
ncbi:MAG: peptidylprolyl isomerase [Phycisphaerales bacterium]